MGGGYNLDELEIAVNAGADSGYICFGKTYGNIILQYQKYRFKNINQDIQTTQYKLTLPISFSNINLFSQCSIMNRTNLDGIVNPFINTSSSSLQEIILRLDMYHTNNNYSGNLDVFIVTYGY